MFKGIGGRVEAVAEVEESAFTEFSEEAGVLEYSLCLFNQEYVAFHVNAF